MILMPNKEELNWLSLNQPLLKYENQLITGIFRLSKSYKGKCLRKKYIISIDLSVNDENQLPITYINNEQLNNLLKRYKISKSDIHINKDDSMCLCIPELNKLYLKKGYNLVEYINLLLEPFLYWISYYMEFKSKPWDDYSHGYIGYIEAVKNKSLPPNILEGIMDRIDQPYLEKLKRGYI